MFAHLQHVKPELISYLTTINENINWTEFLNKFGTLDDERIMKRIRSLVWTDKSINPDLKSANSEYFDYYTKMINKFLPLLRRHKPYILTSCESNPHGIIDEFISAVNQKVSVLHRILTLYGITYTDTTSISPDMKVVFPTASITYKDPTSMFSSFKGIVIPDDFNNICFTDKDVTLNTIILHIESIRASNLDEKTLLTKTYGMLEMGKK